MKKFLVIVLALAFAVGLTCAAYAEVQNVKVSGDITALGIVRALRVQKESQFDGNTNSSMASIARVKVSADLTDNVSATVRLLNERYWGSEDTTHGSSTGVDIDLAYATIKEFFYSPLSVTVGRQELHFGNDMIVGDPDTNNMVTSRSAFALAAKGSNAVTGDPDLSARKAFDAVRATLNYDPLVIDALYARVNEASGNQTINDKTDLFGLNANYNVGNKFGLKNTIVEAYYFLKQSGRKVNAVGNVRDAVHTVGGRLSTEPIDSLVYQLESAYQFGKYDPSNSGRAGAGRSAWALETALSYTFKKVKTTPMATIGYAYFSGDTNSKDTNGSGTYHAWDPMYENQKFGDIANALFSQSNAHILTGQLSAKPMDDLTLKGEYYAFWWDKPYTNGSVITDARGDNNLNMSSKRFAGQEIDMTITYDYTEDVQFGLLGGLFFPGKAFKSDQPNINTRVASEVIGSMKVSF